MHTCSVFCSAGSAATTSAALGIIGMGGPTSAAAAAMAAAAAAGQSKYSAENAGAKALIGCDAQQLALIWHATMQSV
jgi:hypothetical protein